MSRGADAVPFVVDGVVVGMERVDACTPEHGVVLWSVGEAMSGGGEASCHPGDDILTIGEALNCGGVVVGEARAGGGTPGVVVGDTRGPARRCGTGRVAWGGGVNDGGRCTAGEESTVVVVVGAEGEDAANGNVVSSKMTCLEVSTRRVAMSKHL